MEVGGQPAPPFGLVELAPPRDDDDALVGQCGPYRVEEHPRVTAGDLLGALTDPAQLLARRQAVGGPHRKPPHLVTPLEPCDPHHVELVEVGREDGQELRAFQECERRIRGEREHPGVEVEQLSSRLR